MSLVIKRKTFTFNKILSSVQLAQFRQRKAQTDGQTTSKKQKKKRKTAGIKDEESIQDGIDIDRSRGDETSTCSSRRGAAATADFAVTRTLHSGEIIKHIQAYTNEVTLFQVIMYLGIVFIQVNGCSFVTRTTIPTDLIREEELGVGEICSEHGMQHSLMQLEVMENELAGKQQEIEELNRELEEMRAAYGTEGLQQLQEFEAAIKKRDDIITQLTTNLQQARKEKDETMREFLELTEQSQKLQIQFQHLQASEALRNTSHSCTAADLLQAKQQILSHQQQLEDQECLLKNYQKKNEEFEVQITHLQEMIKTYEMEIVQNKYMNKLQEKEALVEELEAKLKEEEKKSFQLKEKLSDVSKLHEELKEQISLKNLEISNMRIELTTYKQKERQCSGEIKQLMGTVEELQKRCYKDSQSEADIVQRMELETQRRLAQLQAELDEMHGQQIVQMKQELIKQHAMEIEQCLAQQKVELEKTSSLCLSDNVNKDQMHLMNIKINELNVKLQDADNEREKIKQELSKQMEVISAEKSLQQTKIEDLLQELNFSREQVQRAKQTIMDMECRLNEAEKYQFVIEDLKTQLASASEFRKELELKHEAEVTNYKIKLEMLEREKDAVLDRMAESQEAELERLRTKLLFSHEEELSRLKEDLEKEHMVNMESLKDNLNMHHKQQLDGVKKEMSQKIEAMQLEKDNLITKQNQLILEISKLKDLQQSIVNSKSEEMTLQIHELQKEIEVLRQEEKEKGSLEQEIQELQLKTELMQKQMREREDSLQNKCSELETQNNLLQGENKTLEEKLKSMLVISEENAILNDSVSCKSENLDVQKRIENLITENEQLKKQNIQLQEDTEKQKSAFLSTEKELEANYKGLQKECESLLKAKNVLEENMNKLEAEYKIKLKALSEELHHLQSNRPVLFKSRTSSFEESNEKRVFRADTPEAGEVVEKDATELMEKLEVTQREKLELSLRLSDLSEQLKSKHSEVCHLSEKVKSLKDEKDKVLAKCKELECIISHAKRDNVTCENGLMDETSLIAITQTENNNLQQQVNTLKSEQADLQLQMEAQRICLSLVYSAHVDQVREHLKTEKESELCSLKEELLRSHLQEMNDLKKVHQMELQTMKIQPVIVSMSIAFAKQSELSRIARQKKEETRAQIVHQQGMHFKMKSECSIEEGDGPLKKATEKCKHEELKSLCKELSEESGEMGLLGEQLCSNIKSDYVLGQTTHESVTAEGLFSHVQGHTAEETLVTSDMETSSQLLIYEERLEDMRQELVRQYQEHQQATELLRQGHMQQMERQKENQEQLLAELESLKVQLAERVSMENDNLAAERERMLLEELKSLRQHPIPGKERLFRELQNSSTQTEKENENQNDVREQISEDEDEGRKPDEVSSVLLSKERHVYQKANEKLMKILLEVVKTTVAMEETIGRHVLVLLDRSGKVQPSKPAGWDTEAEDSVKPTILYVNTIVFPESCSSYHGNSMGDDDISMWSGAAEEGLLSQHLAESGVELDPENEELVLNISSRLQAAVEKLLEAINETSNQLEHAKITQTELMRESFKKQEEATEFIRYQEELQERLSEETKAREQLALELSKAEGLIDGYADEKAFLEKQLQEKIDVIDHLEQELLCTGNKLQELEAEQQQIQEEKELLARQKDAMRADAGPVEQQLLEETEKLMKEKIEVQRQAEKEYDDLQKQVKILEIDLEEQVNRFIELEQEKNAELMDLRQQNQALEKQLEKTRKFLDEQAVDREHERDVFQQEIQKLEQQLKVPQRSQPVNEHQSREVEQLTNHLKEKTDKCSELLLSKEQLQRDIQERNEEIEKLECRIRELEQALIISADNLQKVEERKQFGTIFVKGELPLEIQLQAEREAVDRKEKEVTNLEEQLEQFREELENKNEEVQQLHMQLEIQRKESTTHLQELEQENKLFKDEMKILGLAIQKSEDATIKDHHLVAGKLAHIMQEKEQEIDNLHEQIAKLQQQLEGTTDNKIFEEQNEHIRELEAQVECLKSDQERVKKKNDEEIEQLNDVIDKLQQELANIEQIPADITAFHEDADSLKHTLETVLAEKEALEKQVESINLEASQTKNELEETKLEMNQLKQEMNILRKEHEEVTEKYKCALMKGDREKTEVGSNRKTEKVDEVSCGMTELLDQTQLRSSDENTRITISKMEVQLQQLQACIKEKDSELSQSYNEIKDLKEQGKAEREILGNKILELEKTLLEKVAAALVSQVQLNAVQEQGKFLREIQETSKCLEEVSKHPQTEGVSDITENEVESELSLLTQRLREVEEQLAKTKHSLEQEKENVKITQQESKLKEERLLELQQLLKEVQEKHRSEIQKYIKQEEMQTYLVIICNFLLASAAKEELSSCREETEKLHKELSIKEANLVHLQEDLCKVKEKLVQVEEKLANYVRMEKDMAKTENRKDAEILCDLLTSKSTLTGKSTSSQTDKTVNVSSYIQTSPVLVKNAEIQIDLQSASSSEEIAEIIREFNEKIEQMQELHAAEIMDMETRHISESEALKREKFVAVQVLTDECNALKEVIESLRAKEGIPISGLARSPPYQARDGCSSDSSSDWSQGMYLAQTQGSDTISEGPDEGETSSDLLPQKIKGLLRAVHREGVQVLSLTEFPYGEREMPPLKQGPESWLEERKAFLSTISSLKDLISKMQLHREAEIYASSEPLEGDSDWRGELLCAIQQVFVREQNVLLAVFQTELAELGTRDAVVLMSQLEHRLQEQAINQKTAMDCLHDADRRSLLMEIQVLHAQMNSMKNNPKREQEIDSKSQEMLEYSMQQKQSQILEMQVELRSVKDRAAELQEQLNSERMMSAELKNELAQAKLELETTLKAQHKHFKDLETIRSEVKEKAAELDVLKDTMASEQKKSRELQWALEKEKAKMERSEERRREELEDLKFSLEDQKQKNLQLNELLEEEKQLSSDLQQKIESQEALSAAQLSRERGRNSELQVLLESEKVRALEISSALEREKELCAQLQSAERKGQAGTPNPSEELLKELQKQMDEKHDRIVELVSEMEKYKLESVQVRQQMEKERQIQRKALQAEQDANIIAQKKLHELESKVEDLQWQLGQKEQEVHKLGNETKKLKEVIQELQMKEQESEGEKEAERMPSHNQNETTWNTSNERTRNWVLQQKMEGAETNESTYPTLTGGGDLSAASGILEAVRQKLQSASPKLKQLAQKAASRLQFETADDQDFIAIQNAIEEVISELQKLPGVSCLEELKLALPPGTPSSSLTERLLRQNAQLTGFVSRLSEEKNNLRNAVMKLEEELRRYQHRRTSGEQSSKHSSDLGVNIDTLVASEKENWNREKLSLQKSLKQADAELSKLRAELRSEAFLRELGSDSENVILRRIYGKYLRAESFRKALIYQKKYLLLLLGGFQECEEATLALIARMGGQPSYTDLEIITHHSKGFTRFRTAVRVAIAISRMKFLVRRWHRVTGSGILSLNRDVFSQNTGNELRPDSFSSGMDLYGEQRHSYRSRSDMESPRSPINFQQNMQADLNPVSFACSQLQNYDPERALTDYIHRLEALQRRLGSVQSVSTSYTQLHSAMRR
uniref:A-kinase anchoring protein 9 n=1 Tax=Chrysolophus pictus TaxID=9089 RepID=A0A8C3L801_CHRPC